MGELITSNPNVAQELNSTTSLFSQTTLKYSPLGEMTRKS